MSAINCAKSFVRLVDLIDADHFAMAHTAFRKSISLPENANQKAYSGRNGSK